MIAATITRLQTMATSPFKAIEGAAGLAALRKALPPRTRLPLAYVYPLQITAGPDQSATGVTLQEARARIGIAILAGAQAEREGGQAAQDIEALCFAVRARLIGWQPADTQDEIFLAAMIFAGGQLLEIDEGMVLWADEFTIAQMIRS